MKEFSHPKSECVSTEMQTQLQRIRLTDTPFELAMKRLMSSSIGKLLGCLFICVIQSLAASIHKQFSCTRNGVAIKCGTNANVATSTTSPNSSESSCSVDSGQCSGRSLCLAHRNVKNCTMSESTASSEFSTHVKTELPSYVRMAASMDHVLRTASTIYSLLDANVEDAKVIREFVQKVQIYIQLVQKSACQPFLANEVSSRVEVIDHNCRTLRWLSQQCKNSTIQRWIAKSMHFWNFSITAQLL